MAGKIKAAILVDADNLPIKQAEEALKKLAEICNPVIKKAFGDFTGSAKSWTPEFMRWHGFTPVLHFPATRFKNGADIAMCISAMDIVHAKSVEAIVIFTSDSDFAALAARIRESGIQVVGVGDSKANAVLQGAFDRFVVVDMPKPLKKIALEVVKKIEPQVPAQKKNSKNNAENKKIVNAGVSDLVRAEVIRIVGELTRDEGPVLLAQVHAQLKNKFPNFNVKEQGFASLSKYFGSIGALDLVNNNRKVKLVKAQQ